MSDTELRVEALMQAVKSAGSLHTKEQVLERAQTYYDFLTAGKKPDAKG